ncbi:MAG: hypothetical protein WAV05_11225 [Anaerolineales bacterium]
MKQAVKTASLEYTRLAFADQQMRGQLGDLFCKKNKSIQFPPGWVMADH